MVKNVDRGDFAHGGYGKKTQRNLAEDSSGKVRRAVDGVQMRNGSVQIILCHTLTKNSIAANVHMRILHDGEYPE
jgi:hypothetical protein